MLTGGKFNGVLVQLAGKKLARFTGSIGVNVLLSSAFIDKGCLE